jgi:hypothetical protein
VQKQVNDDSLIPFTLESYSEWTRCKAPNR